MQLLHLYACIYVPNIITVSLIVCKIQRQMLFYQISDANEDADVYAAQTTTSVCFLLLLFFFPFFFFFFFGFDVLQFTKVRKAIMLWQLD